MTLISQKLLKNILIAIGIFHLTSRSGKMSVNKIDCILSERGESIFQDETPQTPTTLAYIEETKLSGLPVIPFAYPTCVIVEKMNSKTRERVRCDSEDSSSPEPTRMPSGMHYGSFNCFSISRFVIFV